MFSLNKKMSCKIKKLDLSPSWDFRRYLHVGTFSAFLSLERLNLNVSLGIRSEMFANLPKLRILNLNLGGRELLPCHCDDLCSLEKLDLFRVDIKKLEFFVLPKLYSFRMSMNYILNEITHETFKNLPKLKILNLSRNQNLATLHTKCFSCLPFLEELNLSLNQNLSTLHPKCF